MNCRRLLRRLEMPIPRQLSDPGWFMCGQVLDLTHFLWPLCSIATPLPKVHNRIAYLVAATTLLHRQDGAEAGLCCRPQRADMPSELRPADTFRPLFHFSLGHVEALRKDIRGHSASFQLCEGVA
jgi:hypothetical protein